MRILLLTSHAIAEYDDLRMFTDMGYEVFSIGGAYDETPFEGKRPAIPNVQRFPEFEQLCHDWRVAMADAYGDPGPSIDWAKARLHPEIVEWADVIIVHHFPDRWIADQWHNIRGKRVIWRTCGQSNPGLEQYMTIYRQQGLQIVRYSPAERRYFEAVGSFAGEDAVIRFGKYPDDYGPWLPEGSLRFQDGHTGPYIANVTQNMVERGEAVGLDFYLAATEGLPAVPAGPGSEQLPNGLGSLDYDFMRQYLARARAYIYTGTKPASYTLGLMEAMLTGVPVVSVTKDQFGCGDLFEGDEITRFSGNARGLLETLLQDRDHAAMVGHDQRLRAVEMFGIETIAAQWQAFLA